MRPHTTSHLVLATLGMMWLAAVVQSLRYHDLVWLQVLFIDITWLQALLLIAGGYGAFLVLVGALSRAARPMPLPVLTSRPFVSVIVPARNEEAVIESAVRSLCAMDYHDGGVRQFEVIVVDDQSTDRTLAVLEKLAADVPLRIVRTPPGSVGKATALNRGITRARGDVIAIFDADARVALDFLQRTVPYLKGERVGGVQSLRLLYNAGQNLLTRSQDDEYRLFQRPLQRARRFLGGLVCFAGNGLLLKRDALDDVGGWNEDALTEDIDLSIRFHLAGWEIRYAEDAVVWEEAVPTLRDLIRQRVRWFEGAMRCLGDHLPAILFGRAAVLKRVDMLFFLSGTLIVTLGVLTTYLFAVIDVVGAVVLYLQLPRRLTTWPSAVFTGSLLLAMTVEARWRVWHVAVVLARTVAFSLLRLIVVPLAIRRYVRSAITGDMSWEKTAHGARAIPDSGQAGGWAADGHPEATRRQ